MFYFYPKGLWNTWTGYKILAILNSQYGSSFTDSALGMVDKIRSLVAEHRGERILFLSERNMKYEHFVKLIKVDEKIQEVEQGVSKAFGDGEVYSGIDMPGIILDLLGFPEEGYGGGKDSDPEDVSSEENAEKYGFCRDYPCGILRGEYYDEQGRHLFEKTRTYEERYSILLEDLHAIKEHYGKN